MLCTSPMQPGDGPRGTNCWQSTKLGRFLGAMLQVLPATRKEQGWKFFPLSNQKCAFSPLKGEPRNSLPYSELKGDSETSAQGSRSNLRLTGSSAGVQVTASETGITSSHCSNGTGEMDWDWRV